jgi:hypothetical protein
VPHAFFVAGVDVKGWVARLKAHLPWEVLVLGKMLEARAENCVRWPKKVEDFAHNRGFLHAVATCLLQAQKMSLRCFFSRMELLTFIL